MVDTKPPSEWARKWQNAASTGQAEFTSGIRNAKDWAGPTAAAKDRALAGLTAAFTAGRFEKGVQERGTAGWKSRTEARANNWGAGVRASVADYSSGAARVAAAMQGISLPVTGAKGSVENENRALEMMRGLRKAKLEGRV